MIPRAITPRARNVAAQLRPRPRTADEIVAALRALREADARNAYQRGVLLIELSAPDKLAHFGAADLADAVEKLDLMHPITAEKSIAFAKAFDEAQVESLTFEKGQALMRYAQTVLRGRTAPRVLLASDHVLGRAPVSSHTAASIKELIARWLKNQRKTAVASDPTVKAADRAVRRLGPKIRKATGGDADLERVRRRGRMRVRIEVDVEVADKMAAILAEVLKGMKP